MVSFARLAGVIHFLTGLTGTALALPTCNLGCAPCSGAPACLGPCPAPVPVVHAARDACASGGSFDLAGTGFDGSGGVPPLRFWTYSRYESANSGCQDPTALGSLLHAGGSRWLLDADWSEAGGDGCIEATPAPGRAVAELSFADANREGTIDHRAFYLAASVDDQGGAYDFDRIAGGDGCNAREIVIQEVPHPTIPPGGPTMQCTGNLFSVASVFEASNPFDCDYRDLEIELPIDPVWYSEAGASSAPALVQGLEILYLESWLEPSSSEGCVGWLPARDPMAPALALGALPLGTRSARIAIPNAYAGRIWIATRIVYADPLNPTGPYDPVAGPVPSVVSPPGSHCGPVNMSVLLDVPLMTSKGDFLPDTAVVGVGEPLSYVFSAHNFGDWLAGYGVVLSDVFPPCLDLSGFDPIAFPSQISSPTMPLVVEWTAATRTLRLHFQNLLVPFEDHDIVVSGLFAGTVGDCVNEVSLESTRCRIIRTVASDTTRIALASGCPVLPVPVTGVTAVRAAGAVELRWNTSPDVATDRYNVWSTDYDKSLIPRLNQVEFAIPKRLACADVPRGGELCTDARALPTGSIRYYQVRGACADGREGTDHP